VHVGETLWQRPVAAADLAKIEPAAPTETITPTQQTNKLIQQIDASAPLLGWTGFSESDPRGHGLGLTLMVLGWLITAGATMFGAPFWFDILQRFVQLRGSGRPPARASQSA
jgi:hypothetical protein